MSVPIYNKFAVDGDAEANKNARPEELNGGLAFRTNPSNSTICWRRRHHQSSDDLDGCSVEAMDLVQ